MPIQRSLPNSLAPYANVLQLIGFQVVWFAWALGIPVDLVWPGLVASVIFLALHVLWRASSRDDARAVMVSLGAGFVLDSLLMRVGLLNFASPNPVPLAGWQPWWMGLLWACLGCTLHHSLGWLKARPLLAAGLGAVSGVLSYEAAARMGVLALGESALVWPWLALFWAVFIPWTQSRQATPRSDSLG